MSYQAEYIWIDGTEPSPLLRSKTRIVEDGKEPGIWGFDGSSTNQALGHDSDCVLQPVFVCPDPLRADGDKLVMCEVLLTDMSPHPTNTASQVRRAGCRNAPTKSRCSELSRSTPSFSTAAHSDGPKAGSRRLRARITAASAATRCLGARSSSVTPSPA